MNFNQSMGGTTPFTDMAFQLGLLANTELTFTVPGTAIVSYRATFSVPDGAAVWVGLNRTAQTPTPNVVTSNCGCELNPDIRYVHGGDVLHFKSILAVTDVGIGLLQLPS